MPITLLTGPANAGKAQVVLETVRAHVARGEGPLLIVPTDADEARYRRELAEGGLALGVRVERFEGLLGEVCRRSGVPQATLSPLVRERVLATLADARPGYAKALARVVADLEIRRVTPARLRGALAAMGAAERGQDGGPGRGSRPGGNGGPGLDGGPGQGSELALGGEGGQDGEQSPLERLCTVFEGYHETLASLKRSDRELRVTRALDALRRTPTLWGSTPVLLYGFDDLTELQLDAIETLGGVVGAAVTVSLAYEPGRVVFAGRAGAFQRLLPHASAHRELPARAEYYALSSREALHHLERSLLGDEERRVPAHDAVRLLAGSSPRAELELVASEIGALLDDGVAAHEIAIVHRAPDTVAALLGEVLEEFHVPHARRGSAMFANTAIGRGLLGVLRCATAQGELGDLLAWLRTPGVLERPELADRLEVGARRLGATDARRARELWELENWPLDHIDRLRDAAAKSPQALIDALVAELQRLFSAPRRALAAVLDAEQREEGSALASGRRALLELRELARSAPSLALTPAQLIEVLEGLEVKSGERPGKGVVAVLDPLSLRARRVRMLFLCGMQEGVFPAPAVAQPLLGEEDRRRLAHTAGLVLGAEPDALAAERYLLYALVSRPRERLTLSWHTADEDGSPRAPSLFVDDVCDLFEADLRERTVRLLAGVSLTSSGFEVRPAAIAKLSDERVLGELRERRLWSASSLESWSSCPVKWFVERLLRGGDIDPDPEPLARGGLAHAALKDTLENLREKTGSARLTPASVGLARKLLEEALERHAPDFPLSVAPERLPGARRRLKVDLERYLEHAARVNSPLEPTYMELEFGFGERDGESGPLGEAESAPLPPLDLGDGILLRGRIDRVDLARGGGAVVYDYKGRSAPAGAKWASAGSLQVALYMRAVERLLGNTLLGGFYQPLAGADIRARGVLDVASGVELDCVRTDRREHAELEELIEACRAAALQAATEMKAGALEPRPDTCAYRGGCMYPTICRCER